MSHEVALYLNEAISPTVFWFCFVNIDLFDCVGLSFCMWDLLPSPGVEPSFPTLGVWSLS